jgi:hypothetical protein
MYTVNFRDKIFEENGVVKQTRVQIQEGMTTITRVLKGDLSAVEDELLVDKVLEQFYQETFPNRAENERFEKLDEKLKLVDEKLAKLDEVKKELDITQGSLMDLITQFGGTLGGNENGDETSTEHENSDKGGEHNDGNAIRN